jgi:predicted ArsR family transcriptional regulator
VRTEVDVREGGVVASGGALSAWMERLAAQLVPEGIPLIGGRILGYLLICDPEERTAAELSEELEASTGSISTNLKLLVNNGMVLRSTRRGRQAAQYRLDPAAWGDLVRRRMQALADTRELTADGLRLLSGDPQRALRLRAVDEFYAWFTQQTTTLWQSQPPDRK